MEQGVKLADLFGRLGAGLNTGAIRLHFSVFLATLVDSSRESMLSLFNSFYLMAESEGMSTLRALASTSLPSFSRHSRSWPL